MRVFSVFAVSVAVAIAGMLFCASCQGEGPADVRQVAAAQSQQDVIDAWNLHCGSFNFASIQGSSSVEVGSLYSGSDFATDSEWLMINMQLELHSGERLGVLEDNLLSEVLDDPVWYE